MNFLDIIIIVPCIYFGWNGFKKGFVISLFTLLALLVGLYAGIHFSDFLCQWFIEKDILTGKYTPPISFTLVFLVVGAVVYFIGVLIQKLIKVAQLNTLNKVIGMFLGLIKAAYILSFVMILTESYDVDNKLVTKEIKTESLLFEPTKNICLITIPAIKETILVNLDDFNSENTK